MTKKRTRKIIWIISGSILGLILILLIAISVIIFSSGNLASVVKKVLNNQDKIEYSLDEADLVFFRTFPELSLHVQNFGMTDRVSSEKFVSVEDLYAALNIRAFLKNKELKVRKISSDGVYADLSMFTSDPSEADTAGGPFRLPFKLISLSALDLDNIHLIYKNTDGMNIESRNLSLKAKLESNEGYVNVESPFTFFSINDTVYCKDLPIKIELPFKADFDSLRFAFNEAGLDIDGMPLNFSGNVDMGGDDGIAMDLDLAMADWDISDIAALIPEAYIHYIEGIEADGLLSLDVKASGILSSSEYPAVNGRVGLDDVSFKAPFMPVDVDRASADIVLMANFNEWGMTNAVVKNISIVSGNNKASLAGGVDDILGDMRFDVNLKSDIDVADIRPFLPDSLNLDIGGAVSLDIDAASTLNTLRNGNWNDVDASGTVAFTDLKAVYNEDISVMTPHLGLDIIYEDLSPLSLACSFDIEDILFKKDSLGVSMSSSCGNVVLEPSEDDGQGRISLDFKGDSTAVNYGRSIALNTGDLKISGSIDRDSSASGVIAKFRPELKVDLDNGLVGLEALSDSIHIPSISMSFREDSLKIAESGFLLGDSDFNLSGTVTDIDRFLSDRGLLKADLQFVSGTADVDQLMTFFSGMGSEEEETEQEDEGNPFIVPKGIDLTLHTDIDKAVAFGNSIENVGGEVIVKDGIAVLKQLGFTSDAARMQLTAMYKSPRKNHLFLGLDFHLIDIQIDKLIQMIPKVDSIVPMLKSFEGEAEFHLAAETYLNSKYELKKSTLLGAAAIEAQNLVVLDSDTFDKIAHMLHFKKNQKNVIDSLAVDMSVFRNEVDIYPFVVSMDKYKLILSGRHNLDMSFDYHLDCVSPVRLGLDVGGKLGDLHFKLTPTRYKNLFVPERRNDVQKRTVKFMELINSSLKETVMD